MNDQQIYGLMAKTPNIRAVQIADALDAELVDVSNALRSLVEVGDVVKHAGTGPNGLQAQMYNLSAAFKKSREGAALMASAAAEPAPAPAPIAPVGVPVFAEQKELQGSKVDRAIAYVELHGSATDDQLRIAMGVAGYPTSHLTSATRCGKLHKDGGVWKAGPAPTKEGVDNVVMVGNTILASKDSKAIAPEVVAAVAAVDQPEPEADAAPVYRCALWSDGDVEVQRDGARLAALPLEAVEAMMEFLTRMGKAA